MILMRFSMQGKKSLSILITSVMCLHFSMQEEEILEHNNAKCYLYTKRKEKRNIKVLYPNMQCPFTTSLSCPREHENGAV